MIPVSTLYDEYIERRKFTEQKNPFEYIVPPPSRGSEQLIFKNLRKNFRKSKLQIVAANLPLFTIYRDSFRFGSKKSYPRPIEKANDLIACVIRL